LDISSAKDPVWMYWSFVSLSGDEQVAQMLLALMAIEARPRG